MIYGSKNNQKSKELWKIYYNPDSFKYVVVINHGIIPGTFRSNIEYLLYSQLELEKYIINNFEQFNINIFTIHYHKTPNEVTNYYHPEKEECAKCDSLLKKYKIDCKSLAYEDIGNEREKLLDVYKKHNYNIEIRDIKECGDLCMHKCNKV